MKQPLKLLTLFQLIMSLLLTNLSSLSFAAEKKETRQTPPKTSSLENVTFLGAKLIEQDLNSIRKLLWNTGGFIQAKSTVQQKNIDKFYPWSNLRDSYYIECRYTPEGKLSSLYRLFRYQSIKFNNRRTPITTREVAQQIQKQVKQTPKVITKSWGGSGTYRAYIWEDDKMKIIVDRQGSERWGKVFVLYQIKPIQTYLAYQ